MDADTPQAIAVPAPVPLTAPLVETYTDGGTMTW